MPTEVAELGGDAGNPGVVKQTDHEITENGENVGATAAVDEAGILRESNVLRNYASLA